MYVQSLACHEQVQQSWLPIHLQIQMTIILKMRNQFHKRPSKELRKCATYDTTPTTSCWIPDPPEWLTIMKTTSKNKL
jgi:hypothetical protein